jgi:RHS repeat-associated protein
VTSVQTRASASDPSWTVLASDISYEPFGSVKAMALGNGLLVANDWGNDGRLASRRLYRTSGGANLSWLAYGYDANDNIGAIRDLIDDSNSAYYGYDANDRLTLTSRVLASAPSPETYTYTSGTNRLASIATAAGTRSIAYDNRGNAIAETRPGGGAVSATYDGYGRLTAYARSGDPAQANAYNGLDDRVSASSGGTVHRFVYGDDVRVLGEYGASAADVIAETIWLSPEVANDNQSFGGGDGVGGYAPLAVATGSGSSAALTWLHGNHMGVPIAFTDASGAAVAAPSYTLPGFPGQMQSLSDLYYNRHRDYDSSTGRYIQADPIGLQGGSNPYLYAEADPLRYTDPSGLVTLIIIGDALYPNKDDLGNPFGHASIAFMDCGCVYSEGTGTPPGSDLVEFLDDQSKRRRSIIYFLDTTTAQERLIRAYLKRNRPRELPNVLRDPIGAAKDNCATRIRDALLYAGVPLTGLSGFSPALTPGDLGSGVYPTSDKPVIYPKKR